MTIDFTLARENMVDCQVRTSDVTNLEVIAAFSEVPREAFVPEHVQSLAYIDEDMKIAPGRYLIAPASAARLIQAAMPKPDDIALVIGCGSGYSTAVLSLLTASVVALECDEGLARVATETLGGLGYDNVAVVEGPLPAGFAPEGPYDLIFIDGGVGQLPDAIGGQLKQGGRLIAVEGGGNSASARLWVREGEQLSSRRLFNCALPPLPGFEKAPAFEF